MNIHDYAQKLSSRWKQQRSPQAAGHLTSYDKPINPTIHMRQTNL